jgi:hypothetical protein
MYDIHIFITQKSTDISQRYKRKKTEDGTLTEATIFRNFPAKKGFNHETVRRNNRIWEQQYTDCQLLEIFIFADKK